MEKKVFRVILVLVVVLLCGYFLFGVVPSALFDTDYTAVSYTHLDVYKRQVQTYCSCTSERRAGQTDLRRERMRKFRKPFHRSI